MASARYLSGTSTSVCSAPFFTAIVCELKPSLTFLHKHRQVCCDSGLPFSLDALSVDRSCKYRYSIFSKSDILELRCVFTCQQFCTCAINTQIARGSRLKTYAEHQDTIHSNCACRAVNGGRCYICWSSTRDTEGRNDPP